MRSGLTLRKGMALEPVRSAGQRGTSERGPSLEHRFELLLRTTQPRLGVGEFRG
jgi:hypothetical protein